jgi:hypothetical protein
MYYIFKMCSVKKHSVCLLQLCGESSMGDAEERCSEVVEVFVVRV